MNKVGARLESQFEVICSELDRFEGKLSDEEAHNNLRSELSCESEDEIENANKDVVSSLSYEDIDV